MDARQRRAHGGEPTETSPLLPKPLHPQSLSAHPIDPSGGVVPEGADPYHDGDPTADSEETLTGEVTPDDGSDLERQTSNASVAKGHDGMPEVKKRMWIIFPAVSIGVFLAAADQTIIVSSYGRIGSEMNALNKTSWIATGYFLTLTAFQPLYGKLSDIFGRKSCLLFAYGVFGLGCLWCGLSRSIDELICARAFAGIGGGGMTTVVSILLTDIMTLRERGKWQGYVNIIYASGAGTGAPLGGILSDYIGWRWAFLGQAPLCAIAFLAVFAGLHLPKLDSSHWKDKLKRIDFLGAMILLGAVVSLLSGLDRGSNVGWSDKITIASLCSSVPLFLIFSFVEIKVASEPFAPGHIIFESSLFAAYLCNFFSFSGWLATLFYIPLYLQTVDRLSATQAGLQLIPAIICGVSGSLFGGVYMSKTGRYYWLTVTCYSTLVIGAIIIVLFAGVVTHSVPGIVIGMMICGFSNGIGVTSTLIGLIANAGRENIAVATACSYLFRSLGSVFGVSISATAFNQALRAQLRDRLGSGKDAEKIAERVRQSLEYLKELAPDIRSTVRQSYAKSASVAFSVQIVLVFGAALAAWWIREKTLGK